MNLKLATYKFFDRKIKKIKACKFIFKYPHKKLKLRLIQSTGIVLSAQKCFLEYWKVINISSLRNSCQMGFLNGNIPICHINKYNKSKSKILVLMQLSWKIRKLGISSILSWATAGRRYPTRVWRQVISGKNIIQFVASSPCAKWSISPIKRFQRDLWRSADPMPSVGVFWTIVVPAPSGTSAVVSS